MAAGISPGSNEFLINSSYGSVLLHDGIIPAAAFRYFYNIFFEKYGKRLPKMLIL